MQQLGADKSMCNKVGTLSKVLRGILAKYIPFFLRDNFIDKLVLFTKHCEEHFLHFVHVIIFDEIHLQTVWK